MRKTYLRAAQIWPLLVRAAGEENTLTYGELADKMGMKPGAGRVMGRFLDPIMRYCDYHGLPPLTALVTKKTGGLPSDGLTTIDRSNSRSVGAAQSRVFEYDWMAIPAPQADDF